MYNFRTDLVDERRDLYKTSNKFSFIKYVVAVKASKLISFLLNLINFLLSLVCIVFYILMTYDPHIFIKYDLYLL